MKGIASRIPSVAPLCFFLISVAYKLAWTAISSLLSQYSKAYGPDILLRLNVAYFFPSIPILMLQTVLNDRMDRRLGVPAGVLTRFCVGLGGLVALTRYFPAVTAGSEQALLITTVLVGVSYGIAFGTSYQIAAKFAAGSTVALTTGFVSSGPVILLLDLALKRGPYYAPEGLELLFKWVAGITAAGLAAAAALVLGSWRLLSAGPPHRVELKVPYKAPPPPSYGGKDGGGTAAYYAHAHAHASDRTGTGPYVRHKGDPQQQLQLQGYDSSGGGSGGMPPPLGGGGLYGNNAAAAANGFRNHGHGHGHGHGHHAITLDFTSSSSAVQQYGGDYNHQYGNSHHHHLPQPFHQHSFQQQVLHMSSSADGSMTGAHSADESKVARRDLPLLRLAGRILPAALCISLSVGTSMLIFPFFTYMTSTGLLGDRLPQVLFYVRLVGDILGRMVPRRLQATTVRGLMFWAAVKLALVPLLFGCIFAPERVGGDVTAVAAVAAFWVLSGYLNTCSYLVAPTLAPPGQKSRASGLMTVAFQSACFGALMLAYAVQQMELSQLAAHLAPHVGLIQRVAAAAGASPH